MDPIHVQLWSGAEPRLKTTLVHSKDVRKPLVAIIFNILNTMFYSIMALWRYINFVLLLLLLSLLLLLLLIINIIINILHASPHLWNQLPTSLRIPYPNYSSPSQRPSFDHAGLTCYTLLSPSITFSLFHSELETYLFRKSNPPP